MNAAGLLLLFLFLVIPLFLFILKYLPEITGNEKNEIESHIIKDPKTGYYIDRNFESRKKLKDEEKESINPNKFEEKIAKVVKKEIDTQNYNEVTWLKAFKKARGNKNEAQALYVEYRTEQLEEQYYENSDSDKGKSNNKKIQYKKIRSGSESSFFEKSNFLSGRENLTTAFWVYVFIGNIFVGLIVGFLSVIIGSFMLVFLLAYLLFSTVGFWKCADTYTLKKQKMNESYVWAVVARIYVVVNLLYLPFQFFQFIGNK